MYPEQAKTSSATSHWAISRHFWSSRIVFMGQCGGVFNRAITVSHQASRRFSKEGMRHLAKLTRASPGTLTSGRQFAVLFPRNGCLGSQRHVKIETTEICFFLKNLDFLNFLKKFILFFGFFSKNMFFLISVRRNNLFLIINSRRLFNIFIFGQKF